MVVGLDGDLFRGGKAIGMAVPAALSLATVSHGIGVNPGVKRFRLSVNQFSVDIATSIARSFEDAVRIDVAPDPNLGRDGWRLEPSSEE